MRISDWSSDVRSSDLQLVMPRIVAMLLRLKVTRSISFRLDSAHPVGCSHHQKVAVFDDHLAVCGGIDVGAQRWDTRGHKDGDPRRCTPSGKPYTPGYDSTMILAGPDGVSLAALGTEGWQRATKKAQCALSALGERLPGIGKGQGGRRGSTER